MGFKSWGRAGRWNAAIVAVVAGLALAAPVAPGLGFGADSNVAGLPDSAFSRAVVRIDAVHDLASDPTQVPEHLPQPAAATGIGPGSHLILTRPDGTVGCTANFIWEGTNGKKYLGAAGHCFLPDASTATHGPGANYNPALTTTRVCVLSCSFGGELGFTFTGLLVTLGPVAYARQTVGGVDIGNDFGIVEIPTSQWGQIRASLPVWGGPTTVDTNALGKILCHYGNGVVVGETFPTMARLGVGVSGGGAASFRADLAASPGDSGSAVETCGQDAGGVHGVGAIGVLTHLVVGTGITAGTQVARCITMATQAGLTISLVTGA